MTVVTPTDNGADALGLVIAEQPDLLLIEDKLAMPTSEELVAEVALFAPATVVAAQARDVNSVGRLLDAGVKPPSLIRSRRTRWPLPSPS